MRHCCAKGCDSWSCGDLPLVSDISYLNREAFRHDFADTLMRTYDAFGTQGQDFIVILSHLEVNFGMVIL